MRTLYESLLDDEETLFKSDEGIKDEIKEFIENNYSIKSKKYAIYTISDEPDVDGKYIVDCKGDVLVKNISITSLVNDFFKFGIIDGNFYCDSCAGLTSLKGAPKDVYGDFECSSCNKLKSLEGAPKEVGGFFACGWCDLTSLEGAPEKVHGFLCDYCPKIESLKGAPKKVTGNFSCQSCALLTSLEGSPEAVNGNFDCSSCFLLSSLKGAPKKIGKNFICKFNTPDFTIDDVKSNSKVTGKIILNS